MSDDHSAKTAAKVRKLMKSLGVQHTVGLSWNNTGVPVVTVDVPPSVDKSLVTDSLSENGLDAQVRHVTRSIIAH